MRGVQNRSRLEQLQHELAQVHGGSSTSPRLQPVLTHAKPPPTRLSTSLPFSASVGLPLDVLRDVQDTFVANPWLLALPELAPFRTFVVDAAARCQSGEAERALRAVRAETRGALEARSRRESASEGDDGQKAHGSMLSMAWPGACCGRCVSCCKCNY